MFYDGANCGSSGVYQGENTGPRYQRRRAIDQPLLAPDRRDDDNILKKSVRRISKGRRAGRCDDELTVPNPLCLRRE